VWSPPRLHVHCAYYQYEEDEERLPSGGGCVVVYCLCRWSSLVAVVVVLRSTSTTFYSHHGQRLRLKLKKNKKTGGEAETSKFKTLKKTTHFLSNISFISRCRPLLPIRKKTLFNGKAYLSILR
jgi:hypothetical protein